MEATAQNMVTSPATFGLSFVAGTVSTKEDSTKMELGTRSMLVVSDVALFRKMVPTADAVIVGHLDGQSVRVAGQNIIRTALAKNHGTTDAELKLRQVNSIILGARSARITAAKTWKTPTGIYIDRMEAITATAAWFIDETGMDGETALATATKTIAAQD